MLDKMVIFDATKRTMRVHFRTAKVAMNGKILNFLGLFENYEIWQIQQNIPKIAKYPN